MPENEPWDYTFYIPNDPRAVIVCRRTLRAILTLHGLAGLLETAGTPRDGAGVERRTAHQGLGGTAGTALPAGPGVDRGVGHGPRTTGAAGAIGAGAGVGGGRSWGW